MPLQHWKKLGQRTLLAHPRLTVYEDDVMLPSGEAASYVHFGTDKLVGGVAILAIREDEKILLTKELSYPVGEFLWQFPGGKIEQDETPAAAANRELMEEGGYRAGAIEIIGEFLVDNRRSNRRLCVAIATDLTEATLPADTEEAFEYGWFSKDEIRHMIKQGEIINAFFLAAWTLFEAKLK